jgi:hypothetical protein
MHIKSIFIVVFRFLGGCVVAPTKEGKSLPSIGN